MAKLYEDNALGRVNDDFYEKMMKNYDREQKELSAIIAEGELILHSTEQKSADTRLLIRTFREMTDTTKLTPILVNKLIKRIEVHNNDKSSCYCYVKVDIYFTGVGMISIPTAEELIAMMEDIRKNPEEYRLQHSKRKRCNPISGLHRTLLKILPYVVCPFANPFLLINK